ncbi:MAG: hypothetical protein WC955_01505 [Elusimicrobiota bacterium]
MKKLWVMIIAGLFSALNTVSVNAWFTVNNIDIRSTGTGSTGVAFITGPGSVFLNPAKIGKLNDKRIVSVSYGSPGAAYRNLSSGDSSETFISNGCIAAQMPVWKVFVLGLAWSNYSIAGMYDENVVVLAASKKIINTLSAGVNLKYLGNKFYIDTLTLNSEKTRAWLTSPFSKGDGKTGVTLDIGLLWENVVPSLNLGLSVQNVTQPDLGLMTKSVVPAKLAVGTVYSFGDAAVFEDISIIADFGKEVSGYYSNVSTFGFGMETWLNYHMFGLRCGVNSTKFAAGFSWYKSIAGFVVQVDYAFELPYVLADTFSGHHVAVSLVQKVNN